MTRAALCVALAILVASGAGAEENPIAVSGAWAPAAGRGEDIPLSMTIRNAGAADALIRARCTAATFAEPQTVDHGEGFPAMRAVKSIPIEGQGTTTLGQDGFHVMLLQVNHPLSTGAVFTCSVTFRAAGTQEITVTVGAPG